MAWLVSLPACHYLKLLQMQETSWCLCAPRFFHAYFRAIRKCDHKIRLYDLPYLYLEEALTQTSWFKICLPFSVSRYLCLLLVGFSGMVISTNPASSNGFNTWSLNLVLLDRPNHSHQITDGLFWKAIMQYFNLVPTQSRPGTNLFGDFPSQGS